MKKTFKVVMLPTEKASSFHLWEDEDRITLHPTSIEDAHTRNCQHLYIISDEEIKEGDWMINKAMLDRGEIEIPCQSDGRVVFNISNGWCKIVATTDKLSLEPFQGFEMESGKDLTNYVSKISESFIQAYIKTYNEGNPITEVQLEMEQFFDECPDIKDVRANYRIKTRSDNTVIIHRNKTYTREEVKQLLDEFRNELCSNTLDDISSEDSYNKWIEENL